MSETHHFPAVPRRHVVVQTGRDVSNSRKSCNIVKKARIYDEKRKHTEEILK